MNSARQFMIYGDNINILGGSIGEYIGKKVSDTLLVASKEIGLEVKPEKTK